MARNYRHTMFSDTVKALQERHGSRAAYLKMDAGADGTPDALTAKEIGYIALRDSFYMASVTAHGWPYMQHRGGPAGFLRHLGGFVLDRHESLLGAQACTAPSNVSAW